MISSDLVINIKNVWACKTGKNDYLLKLSPNETLTLKIFNPLIQNVTNYKLIWHTLKLYNFQKQSGRLNFK